MKNVRNTSFVASLVLAVIMLPIAAVSQTAAKEAPKPAKSRSGEVLAAWNDIGGRLVDMAEDFPSGPLPKIDLQEYWASMTRRSKRVQKHQVSAVPANIAIHPPAFSPSVCPQTSPGKKLARMTIAERDARRRSNTFFRCSAQYPVSSTIDTPVSDAMAEHSYIEDLEHLQREYPYPEGLPENSDLWSVVSNSHVMFVAPPYLRLQPDLQTSPPAEVALWAARLAYSSTLRARSVLLAEHVHHRYEMMQVSHMLAHLQEHD